MSENKMSLCDRCLNDCKARSIIGACHNYNNPNRRMFDWRCKICNKKIPNLKNLCFVHLAWLELIQRNLSWCGTTHRFRDKVRKLVRKLEAKQ